MRYDALKQTREVRENVFTSLIPSPCVVAQDLLQQDQLNQDAIEAERADLTRFTEEKNNEILGYNNEV